MSFAEKRRGAARPPADPPVSGVEADRLRAAMEIFATGVTVITTSDPDGRPLATTADSVTPVSLRPPLVLTCLRGESETLAALLARRKFAITVLHGSQAELADRFARPSAGDTWHAVAHRSVEDIPVLQGAIASLRCDLHDVADGGDHGVVVGHVIDLAVDDRDGAGRPGSSPTRPAARPAGRPPR